MNHTPGPWFNGKDTEIGDSTCICANVPFHPGSDMVVARVNYYIKESEANARLIAEAPALLDALIEMHRLFDCDMDYDCDIECCDCEESTNCLAFRVMSVIERIKGKPIKEVMEGKND